MAAVVIGGLYLVTDSKLTLLPSEERQVHDERRRFVVLSGSETNSELGWPVVLGCPVSASTRYRTRFDVRLAFGEAGASKKCWIRVPALQPLLKEDLEDLTGTLTAGRLAETQARLAQYLGLISQKAEPTEEPH
ncbi:MAG: type II toxin-antitoxin system PemK/MazF family toxin [Nocardiopsaceae bacterium]|nr:type II toxin-antitoxin system PemK/MazF family toxin [Nocardiopsaceae bacterium]